MQEFTCCLYELARVVRVFVGCWFVGVCVRVCYVGLVFCLCSRVLLIVCVVCLVMCVLLIVGN